MPYPSYRVRRSPARLLSAIKHLPAAQQQGLLLALHDYIYQPQYAPATTSEARPATRRPT